MPTTIAVTGSTGQLGRLAIAALRRRAPEAGIIALARSPASAADLGVTVRNADYTRPETLPAALAGVDVLVLISSNDFNDRVGQHRAVIDAAVAAGVGRILYTSLLRADRSAMLLAADHVATEAAIHASGLSATLLRNGWYTENQTGSLAGALAAGVLIGSSGEGRFPPPHGLTMPKPSQSLRWTGRMQARSMNWRAMSAIPCRTSPQNSHA